jgi:hypothetical protein
LGARLGVRLVAQVVAMPPWWGRSSFTDSIPETPYSADGSLHPPGVVGFGPAAMAILLVLAVLGLLLVLTYRRRERQACSLLAVAAVGVVLSLGTAAVMPAGVLGLAPHQLRWLWPVSILTMLSVVNALDRLYVRERVSARNRLIAAGSVFVVLVAWNVPAHLSDLGPSDSRGANSTIRSLMDQLERVHLPGPTIFDGSTLVFAEPYSGPVLAALTEAGQPVRAGDASFARQLGEHRRRRNDEQWSFQVRQGPDASVLAAGERLLASATAPDGTDVAVVLIELAASDG